MLPQLGRITIRTAPAMDQPSLLASMSHDLRTPMNGVIGMAELLLTAGDLNDRHRRRIEIIKRSGESVLTLIDDILRLSKLEADGIILEPSTFDLHSLINELRDTFEAANPDETLQCTVTAPPHRQAIGDPERLKELFHRFLRAAKESQADGPIHLKTETPPDEPTGIRLSLESISNASKEWDDANICLAICKKLAHAMGGDIGMKASSLQLHVDLKQEKADAKTIAALEPSISSEARSGGRDIKEVVVAEDNPDMAMLIEDLLEEAGYHPTIAPNGATVLKILDEQAVDLILMDGRMPDMSGFETTACIRKLPDERAKVPIIALTAEALAGDRERYLSAGMDDYVTKPVNYERLMEAIKRCRGLCTPERP